MRETLTELLAGLEDQDPSVEEKVQRMHWPVVIGNRATFLFQSEADAVSLQHWIFGLPSRLPLSRLGDSDWWQLTLELPLQSRIEYKLVVTRGGEENWLLDPANPRVAHDPFGGNSVVQMSGYEEPTWCVPDPLIPSGELESWSLPSFALESDREIRVYLPARYRKNRRHRLLVMHDGDDYFKYSRLGTVLDNLTQRLEIPPLITVLLNPGDRLREYGADPRHARFVVEELLPEVERRYPVIGEPSARCLGGASFGAVATLSTAWQYPGVFDLLLLQSGSFAFTDVGQHTRGRHFDSVVAFMNRFRTDVGSPARRIHLSCGIYESLIYENRSLAPLLRRREMETKFVEARDGHNWENWRDRLRDALTWLFPVPLWFYYE